MSSDSSNPFAGLARDLAARQREPGTKNGAARDCAKKAPGPPGRARNVRCKNPGRERDDESDAAPLSDARLMAAAMADPLPRHEVSPEEHAAFAKAMQGVAPVGGKGRAVAAPATPLAVTPAHDPSRALRDVLEGRVEFALHHTDEFMEGYVLGVEPLVLARLRAGQYSPEAHIDLHGMNSRQAYDALTWFVKNCYQKGLRTLVVVTGRGRNSPDGVGVLRPMLQRWLSREPFKRVVLAFCTARPHDGGPGAVYVLLRKYKKSRGKIVWEHSPSDENFPDL